MSDWMEVKNHHSFVHHEIKVGMLLRVQHTYIDKSTSWKDVLVGDINEYGTQCDCDTVFSGSARVIAYKIVYTPEEVI